VLADVFAAQLQHAIESRVIQEGNYLNNDAIGEYLKVNLYQYGNTVPWEKLIEKATGESLNTAYFVNYLVGEQHN
jgi:Zn-dependent M32 family carboxypeptidase